MKDHLGKLTNGRFTIDSIGPSPFHANFFGFSGSEKDYIQINKNLSYDDIEIYVSENLDFDVRDHVEYFFYRLAAEFDSFYELIISRNILINLGSECRELCHDILDKSILEEKIPFKNIFSNKMSKIDKAIMSLVSFKIKKEHFLLRVSGYLKDNGDSDHIVPTYIESYTHDVKGFDFDGLMGMLDILNNRNSERFSIIIVIISASLGGFLGGILAMLSSFL